MGYVLLSLFAIVISIPMKFLGLGGFAVILLFVLWCGMIPAACLSALESFDSWRAVFMTFFFVAGFYLLGKTGEPFLRWLGVNPWR